MCDRDGESNGTAWVLSSCRHHHHHCTCYRHDIDLSCPLRSDHLPPPIPWHTHKQTARTHTAHRHTCAQIHKYTRTGRPHPTFSLGMPRSLFPFQRRQLPCPLLACLPERLNEHADTEIREHVCVGEKESSWTHIHAIIVESCYFIRRSFVHRVVRAVTKI